MKTPKEMPFKKLRMTIFTFVILCITFAIFVTNIVFLCITKDDARRSIIIFNIVETLIMFALIFIPSFVNKITKLKIPPVMEILYIIFCIGSIILGEIGEFYIKFDWWDSLLHFSSGILLGVLGYVIINTFNKYSSEQEFKFSPLFVSFWCVCFALAIGAIWEMIEFGSDEFLGTNMQQFMGNGTLQTGTPLVGHDALRDTMKDLMLDFGGSLIPAVIGFFELRRHKKGFAISYLEKESANNKSSKKEDFKESEIKENN